MTAGPGKPPKKDKRKVQTAEERLAAVRYNEMMYGPTAGEVRVAAKKVDYGAPYLKHPKFLSLMAAFKGGTAFQFTVTDKGRTLNISTDGESLCFEGKVVFYSRHLNKYERNLLMDRLVVQQFQAIEAFVHLVFAVIRGLPELGPIQLSYLNNGFLLAGEDLGLGVAEQGPNLMLGAYRTQAGKVK